MGRLILFGFFLTLASIVLSFSGYKKYFNSSRKLDMQSMVAATQKSQDQQESAEEATSSDSAEHIVKLSSAQLKNGYKVYLEKGQCVTCHGDQGQGNPEQEAPLVAGQYDWYAYDQLTQMKAGKRLNAKMNPYLTDLTDQDLQDVAQFISLLRVGKPIKIVE